jgi:hypothetical protein
MSQENVETVRRWGEAIERGELAEALWAPDLEIVNAKGWALEATYFGHDGLGGRIAHVVGYVSKGRALRALEALGLSEQDAHADS